MVVQRNIYSGPRVQLNWWSVSRCCCIAVSPVRLSVSYQGLYTLFCLLLTFDIDSLQLLIHFFLSWLTWIWALKVVVLDVGSLCCNWLLLARWSASFSHQTIAINLYRNFDLDKASLLSKWWILSTDVHNNCNYYTIDVSCNRVNFCMKKYPVPLFFPVLYLELALLNLRRVGLRNTEKVYLVRQPRCARAPLSSSVYFILDYFLISVVGLLLQLLLYRTLPSNASSISCPPPSLSLAPGKPEILFSKLELKFADQFEAISDVAYLLVLWQALCVALQTSRHSISLPMFPTMVSYFLIR